MPFGMPAVDVYQTEKEVVAELEVPAGIDPEKIEVIVEDNTLTVRGATEEKKEEKERNYYRKEMRHGSFERTILLPSKVNEKKTNAHCEKGILKIVMPKLEEARKQKVQVTVKK
jgi:HSP20 family protein